METEIDDMPCQWCGKDMRDDYFVLNINRIFHGYPYDTYPIFICRKCYDALSKGSLRLTIRKNKHKKKKNKKK